MSEKPRFTPKSRRHYLPYVVCPKCKGEGISHRYFLRVGYEKQDVRETCLTCKGAGEIRAQ